MRNPSRACPTGAGPGRGRTAPSAPNVEHVALVPSFRPHKGPVSTCCPCCLLNAVEQKGISSWAWRSPTASPIRAGFPSRLPGNRAAARGQCGVSGRSAPRAAHGRCSPRPGPPGSLCRRQCVQVAEKTGQSLMSQARQQHSSPLASGPGVLNKDPKELPFAILAGVTILEIKTDHFTHLFKNKSQPSTC